MVTNVTSLLKTVKAVEDEATKGTRALEATIEHIKQELAVSGLINAPSKDPFWWENRFGFQRAISLSVFWFCHAGVLQFWPTAKDDHTRRVYSHDQRNHRGNSKSSGCRELLSSGGHHRHRQPQQEGHCWHAALLQGTLIMNVTQCMLGNVA